MKTKTVKFVERCKICAQDASAAIFLLLAVLGNSGMISDIVGYVTLIFILIPVLILWAVTYEMFANVETLPARDIILDEKSNRIFNRPLDQALTFLPIIDVRLLNFRSKRFIKIHCDDHGELDKDPNWFNNQLELFKEKVKNRVQPYVSYLAQRRARGRLIRKNFREKFSGEINLSYEDL